MIPKLPIQVQICLLTLLVVNGENEKPPIIARPGCRDSCGNVSIPFPFGIGVGCFLDPWFEIVCNNSSLANYSKPFLSKLHIELMEVIMDLKLVTLKIPALNVCTAEDTQNQELRSIDLKESPYSFSIWKNVFIMEGCPGSAVLSNQDDNDNNTIMAGCGVVCNNTTNSVIPRNGCYGVECCRAPLLSDPESMLSYQIDFNRQPSSGEAQKCLVATIMKSDSVNQYVGNLLEVPVVMNWRWNSKVGPDKNRHATCQRDENNILTCQCAFNYQGNPYVLNGCQGPPDCDNCEGFCFHQRDNATDRAIPNKYYCENFHLSTEFHLSKSAAFKIVKDFGIVLAVVAFKYGLYLLIKKIMKVKDRANFFKRNGGLLLQQQLSSNIDVLERTKVFTLSELNKATDNFNENRILGQGGQGTVYKGMLTDGSIVAIKKSKLVDENQVE